MKTALVTGANGYIGNAVARAFVRAGFITYGLVRSPKSSQSLALEEIVPIVGTIDDGESHDTIRSQLPPTLDVIVSTTEDHSDYVRHYNNIVRLIRAISQDNSNSSGAKRPLVIFTSGVKDYGPGPHYASDPALAPHTEESPLRPPPFAKLRAEYSAKIFEHLDDAVLVRPTNVHGRSSSYYSVFFQVAERTRQEATAAGASGTPPPPPLVMAGRPDGICHSLHVDDCGDAYVAIATHPRRGEVVGEVFNISAGRGRYETVAELGRALAAEYGIAKVEFETTTNTTTTTLWPPMILDFPQCTASDKLRRLTGWTDRRPLFSEALGLYRVAYEAAREAGHENVGKTGEERVRSVFGRSK